MGGDALDRLIGRDLAKRTIERNGTPAEKYCHYKRYNENEKASEVLASLAPGDTIEFPVFFTVTHEIYLHTFCTLDGDVDFFEWEGLDFKELAILLEKRNIDYKRLGEIYQAYWYVNIKGDPPPKISFLFEISTKYLEELTSSCHESIRKLATFFLFHRKIQEEKNRKKEEERQKQITANARGLARREMENNCWAAYNVNRNQLWDEAWQVYSEAIKCSNRKDFAAAIISSPFRSVLFFCHDHCVRSRNDFDRAYEQLNYNEITRIAVEIYGGKS